MTQATPTATQPAPASYPSAELINAVADILRFIDRKRRAATFADEPPSGIKPPAPPVKVTRANG